MIKKFINKYRFSQKMHCNTINLEKTCPKCKKEHKIKFKDEFQGHNHYLIGDCPNCNYKIFIKSENITSGKQINHKLSNLEKQLNKMNI
jgi:DNA-directed RNA polymerase subunit RPC12/RpoP